MVVVGVRAFGHRSLRIQRHTHLRWRWVKSGTCSESTGEKNPQNIANICLRFLFAVAWTMNIEQTRIKPSRRPAHQWKWMCTHREREAAHSRDVKRWYTKSYLCFMKCCEVFISNTSFRVIFLRRLLLPTISSATGAIEGKTAIRLNVGGKIHLSCGRKRAYIVNDDLKLPYCWCFWRYCWSLYAET